MLPELARRALTIERFTKGLAAGGFFQKHVAEALSGMDRRGDVLWQDDGHVSDLRHAGGARLLREPRRRSRITSGRAASTSRSPRSARVRSRSARQRLRDRAQDARLLENDARERSGCAAFVKTTGSKGLHVVVPLDGKDTYRDDRTARRRDRASSSCAQYPELLTTEFYKKDRRRPAVPRHHAQRAGRDVRRAVLAARQAAPRYRRRSSGTRSTTTRCARTVHAPQSSRSARQARRSVGEAAGAQGSASAALARVLAASP